jgi:hypothetical protein
VSERLVEVMVDERVRLTTAVLLLTQWPASEQSIEPHAVHMQAKLTRHYLQEKGLAEHPAVGQADELLSAGVSLVDLLTAVLAAPPEGHSQPSTVPATWLTALADFAEQAQLPQTFWPEQTAVWQEAQEDLQALFPNNLLAEFLGQWRGRPLLRRVRIVPTLLLPMLAGVAVDTAVAHYAILPPPKAWGESPPWPYRDGPDWSLGEVCRILALSLMADELQACTPSQIALAKHALTSLFLGEALSESEAVSYLVRAKRQYQLPQLPLIVERLRPWLTERDQSLTAVLTV